MLSALPDASRKIRARDFIGDSVPIKEKISRRWKG